jgi:hypothetical protein
MPVSMSGIMSSITDENSSKLFFQHEQLCKLNLATSEVLMAAIMATAVFGMGRRVVW